MGRVCRDGPAGPAIALARVGCDGPGAANHGWDTRLRNTAAKLGPPAAAIISTLPRSGPGIPVDPPAAVCGPVEAPVVVTVAYRSDGVLPALAVDLARQSIRPSAWLLVDNAPESAPLALAPLQAAAASAVSRLAEPPLPIRLLRGLEGDGFGAGCNRALEALERQGWDGWVWLLNPDTGLPEGRELERLLAELPELPQQALLGTAVLDEHGGLEPSGGWIDRGLSFRSRRLAERQAIGSAPLAVDWLSGCSLLLRPAVQPTPPRFDPRFPLYYEDMDLCLRLAGQGAPILWLPRPRLLHRRGTGSSVAGPRRLQLSTLSYLRFLRRHCQGWVFAVRLLRLLLLNLLRLPLRPHRSIAVLMAAGTVLRESLQRQGP